MKIAVLVLADIETNGDKGRVLNALETTREAKQNGDDVKLVFDGASTRWIGQLADDDNDMHELYQAVEDKVDGACAYCADAFGVKRQVENAGVALLDDHDGHPSVRTMLADGYQVVTF